MKRFFLAITFILLVQVGFGQLKGLGSVNYVPKFLRSDSIGNSNIYSVNGLIGIGTTTPQWNLDVNGYLRVQNNIRVTVPEVDGNLLLGNNGEFSGNEVGLYDEGEGNALAVWDIDASSFYYADGTITSYAQLVGIGTQQPKARLHVYGGNNNVYYPACIFEGGNVLINKTTQTNNAYKLDVGGGVRADSIVINATGADFVFDKGYKMSSIEELAKYIGENKRLPDVPSAETMQKDGASVGEMQTKLLQKVEELTLYLIEQNKRIKTLEEENLALQIKK